jgi:hypothetical protein
MRHTARDRRNRTRKQKTKKVLRQRAKQQKKQPSRAALPSRFSGASASGSRTP